MNFLSNIKSVFDSDNVVDKDRGDLVQTIIITAGFAIAGFLLVNWISTAILNKGADIAECIEGSSSYTAAQNEKVCKNANHAKVNSFKKDSGYKGRFGNK